MQLKQLRKESLKPYIYLFILHGYIANSQYDQLPVGLIDQLVEHCTGIAEVMGSNPVQALKKKSQAFFSQLFSCVVTARIFLLFEKSFYNFASVLISR